MSTTIPRITRVPFSRVEEMSLNQKIDLASAQRLNHARQLRSRTLADRRLAADTYLATIPTGATYQTVADVLDRSADIFQRRSGFATWTHKVTYKKKSANEALVTDSIFFKNGTNAHRTFMMTPGQKPAHTTLSMNPWAITMGDIFAAGHIKGLMERKMATTDAELPAVIELTDKQTPRRAA